MAISQFNLRSGVSTSLNATGSSKNLKIRDTLQSLGRKVNLSQKSSKSIFTDTSTTATESEGEEEEEEEEEEEMEEEEEIFDVNCLKDPTAPEESEKKKSEAELIRQEEELFDLVATGQLIQVKLKLSQMNRDIIQKLGRRCNVEGDTIFHTAVRRQDEAMMDFLLSVTGIDLTPILFDTLLLSVKESNVEIVHQILAVIDVTFPKWKNLCHLPQWKNSEFDSHNTPLMVAAIVGNYDLIALFSARGQKICPKLTCTATTTTTTPPLATKSKDDTDDDDQKIVEEVKGGDSIEEKYFDCLCYKYGGPLPDLRDDYQRLNEYQALTSPEMLCFQANTVKNFDPMLTAFKFIHEMEYVKTREVEFYEDYEELLEKLKNFIVQMLSMCTSTQELDIFLSRRQGTHAPHDRYPRVIMAMEMDLKAFVSHPHTQRTLYSQWAGQAWNEWRYFTRCQKVGQFLRRLVFLPLFLLFVWGEQGNQNGQLLACPLSRCFYECISQIIFICLAVSEHILEIGQPNERMPPNIYLESVLVLFVCGQVKALAHQFCYAPKIFFKHPWSWYDMINIGLYASCFGCWFSIYFQHYFSGQNYAKKSPLERQYWKFTDPLIIADIFLTLGTIMACGKLLRYVQMHSVIGPIQVALGKMCANISNFLIFFIICFTSFGLAITTLYAPYKNLSNGAAKQNPIFTEHSSTLTEIYWDLFGLSSPDSGELLTIAVPDLHTPNKTENYEHYITEITGKFLYSVYSLFGPTILFSSMLVAYMSNTFGKIMEENDTNWKFYRAQIWIYFSRASVMPAPLNLFPTLWDIMDFFQTMRNVKKYPTKYLLTCNCAICFHSNLGQSAQEKEAEEQMYFNLIKVLIQRYFRSKTALAGKITATSEDIASLNEEVDDLKNLVEQAASQMSLQNYHNDDSGGGGSSVIESNQNHYESIDPKTFNDDSGPSLSTPNVTKKLTSKGQFSDPPVRTTSTPITRTASGPDFDRLVKENLEKKSSSLQSIRLNNEQNEKVPGGPPTPPPLPPKKISSQKMTFGSGRRRGNNDDQNLKTSKLENLENNDGINNIINIDQNNSEAKLIFRNPSPPYVSQDPTIFLNQMPQNLNTPPVPPPPPPPPPQISSSESSDNFQLKRVVSRRSITEKTGSGSMLNPPPQSSSRNDKSDKVMTVDG